MKSKWVVFQTHTITLSNGYILLPQSHFLTDAVKFAKYREKHRIHIYFFKTLNLRWIFMVNCCRKKVLKMFCHVLALRSTTLFTTKTET